MRRFTALAIVSLFFMAPAVQASPGTPAAAAPARGIRASAASVRFDVGGDRPFVVAARTARRNTQAQRVGAAVAIGFLGMLGGMWLGAAIEGPCACDDPGLKGAMIGAPIGAVLGAIAGYELAR